ncbi:MAG: adenine phosphoribosyltransferase [Candidatus Omnitrophica bacterium]|nr:adenine phosphoribosyltransferase [Candidatus Omnitrophota bacterium]
MDEKAIGENLKGTIRDVPDFPKKGIIFKDITTLLKDKNSLKTAIDALVAHYKGKDIDQVVSMESRGFIFGSVLAYKLGAGFIPVRKPGKLPHHTEKATYELEYGTDTLEIHRDAIAKDTKVLIVDDLLATGGTACAVAHLIEKLGGKVVSLAFLIELSFLKGRDKLKGYDVFSLIKF